MSKAVYSRRAEADLVGIAQFTRETWGALQADRYVSALEDCCRQLAANPALGRSAGEVRAGLSRMEHEKHVVFYRQRPERIVVVRILHCSMLPGRHPIDEED